MIEQARDLFMQRGYKDAHASSMAETAVKASLAGVGVDEEFDSHWIVGDSPLSKDPEANDYGWMVEQISFREIRRPLQDSSERVEEAAEQVASAVVGFQLRGKPDGGCFLCPSRNEA